MFQRLFPPTTVSLLINFEHTSTAFHNCIGIGSISAACLSFFLSLLSIHLVCAAVQLLFCSFTIVQTLQSKQIRSTMAPETVKQLINWKDQASGMSQLSQCTLVIVSNLFLFRNGNKQSKTERIHKSTVRLFVNDRAPLHTRYGAEKRKRKRESCEGK